MLNLVVRKETARLLKVNASKWQMGFNLAFKGLKLCNKKKHKQRKANYIENMFFLT
jgi:hypothetical protein